MFHVKHKVVELVEMAREEQNAKRDHGPNACVLPRVPPRKFFGTHSAPVSGSRLAPCRRVFEAVPGRTYSDRKPQA